MAYLNHKMQVSLYFVYSALAIVSHAIADNDKKVQLKVPQGVLEGETRYTTKNLAFQRDPIKYYSFEGIPYAQPPIGNLRFKNPLPYNENWKGVYDATKLKSMCPQIIRDTFQGHEDCLFVNVYTKKLNKNSLNPVIVILHGGRFRTGAGNDSTPLDFLLEIDSVVVTFNYRLSILGLLSLKDEKAPGNMQNKDQVLALRWVKKNINYFSGDPNNVALYGYSSGASNAHMLQMSPMAQGLFHKSILISGVFLCDWNSGYEPIALVQDFGKYIGLKTKYTTEDIYKHLMKLPEKELIQKVYDFEFKHGFQINKFALTIEDFDSVDCFLSKAPLSKYKSGNFIDVPVMIAFSSFEFASFLKDHVFENYTKNEDLLLPQIWKIPIGSKLFNDTIRKVKKFYFGSNNIELHNREHLISFTLLMSDKEYLHPINEVIRTHAEYVKSPLYVYRFSYRGGLNDKHIEKYKFQGAAHCDDKAYIFKNNTMDLYSSDNIVRQRLLTLYRNFLETSNPTPGLDTHLLPFQWPPYTNEKRDFLSISDDTVISQDPDGRRIKFWIDLEDFVVKEGHFNRNWKDNCIFR